jgi:N utilization substance protein B
VARRRARTLALAALFQIEVGKLDPEQTLQHTFGQEPDEEVREYGQRLVRGVLAHREDLDRRIGEQSRGWPLQRMANVDRNLLRLGAFELLHEPAVPAAVVIDEAVELARIYSTAESPRFVHGILGELARQSRGGET